MMMMITINYDLNPYQFLWPLKVARLLYLSHAYFKLLVTCSTLSWKPDPPHENPVFNDANGIANSEDPDQTAPLGAV